MLRTRKFQIPNPNFQLNSNTQWPNNRIIWSLESWSLDINWNLVLGAWNFLVRSTRWVWALPFSLATTKGITLCEAQGFVFFSSGYWDVSLPRVRRPEPLKGSGLLAFHASRFPHSEIPGSKVEWHLPGAYRSHPTSFIASTSRGIHLRPFFSLFRKITCLYLIL